MNKLDIRNLRLARQTLLDVILQEGDGPTVTPTLAKKITSELTEVSILLVTCSTTPRSILVLEPL